MINGYQMPEQLKRVRCHNLKYEKIFRSKQLWYAQELGDANINAIMGGSYNEELI